jgi:uncharacterized RDD family membrane protein YckC
VQPDASDDLIVSTPERVAFQYQVAGIGSRFLAQFIDILILAVIQVTITIGALASGAIFNAPELAALIEVILSFILLAGYFLVSEAAWNGQTIGKRSVRLRVVGDQGEPITLGQAAIRNLVRIIDFLPLFYAVGVVAMFTNSRSKRLGDFAAGTLVVRDRDRISLYDLSSVAPTAGPTPGPAATPIGSIWSRPSPTEPALPTSEAQPAERPLDPALRRLVVAYAARRESLPMFRREALAKSAEPALRLVLPEVVAAAGPLAALDRLAEREGISPVRPVYGRARSAMTWGVTSLVFFWLPVISIPTGVLSIVFGSNALNAIRRQPDRYQGEDRARTGRLLGIIGLSLASLLVALLIIGVVFRNG